MKGARPKPMRLISALSFGLFAFAACANVEVADSGSPPGGGGSGGTGVTTPASLLGKYGVGSRYDLTAGLPGTTGNVINGLITITQGEDAPASGLWQLVIDNLDDGLLRSAAQVARELTVDRINEEIYRVAPDFVPVIIEIGDAVGSITKNFQMVSELEIRKSENTLVAKHVIKGVKFEVGGTAQQFLFRDIGTPDVVVDAVPVSINGNIVTFGRHDVKMPLGAIIRLAIDKAIIPATIPGAQDMGDALNSLVDCFEIGYIVYEEAGYYGAPDIYEDACRFALDLAGQYIYDQLLTFDASAMVFEMTGQSRAKDTNNDGKVDELPLGVWNGNINYSGTLSAINNGKFAAKRM